MARQLRMVRPNLGHLPALALPAGYGLRTYCKGDEEHWARIISDSFGGRERTAQDTENEITGRDVFIPDGFLLRNASWGPCRYCLCVAAICR